MKSYSQTFLLVVVVMVLIGGVAFIRNWISTKEVDSTGPGPTPINSDEVRLDFPKKVAEGSPECEIQRQGHHDFWFRNLSSKAVELGLDYQSCKCSEVKVLILKPGEEAIAGATQVLEAASGALPALGPVAGLNRESTGALDQENRWQTLLQNTDNRGNPTETGNVATVPGNATGFVRVSWVGRQIGPQRLKANLWVQKPGDTRSRGGDTSLEVPVMIASPIYAHPNEVPSFTLEPNQYHPFDIYCWSSTRSEFKLLSVREETGDKCFDASVSRVTGAEIEQVAMKLNPQLPSRILCLYHVRVTVYERRPAEKAQLDLGLFRRRIVLTTDQPDLPTLTVTVRGTVRGDVSVGGGANPDKINVETFRASKGTSITVPVRTNQPGMKLVVDSKTPDYVKVDLREHKGEEGKWDLEVHIPGGLAAGQLPPESVVILKVQTQPPRLIRIPIVGRAKPG